MRLNNMNMADIMAFIDDDCYELEEKAEKIFDYIADLEAKLAESEKQVSMLEEHKFYADNIVQSYADKCNNYEQQLEEKDQTIETILKENEELAKKHNVYTWGDEIQQDKIYAITGEALEFLISNQDKISFAVEQLEQLRHDVWTNQADDGYTDMQVDLYELNDVIDVRIMQLKEGK